MFNFSDHSHRRLNPLTNEYVLCSPHRAKRPWQGAEETVTQTKMPEYDPKCYLCPGNSRAEAGVENPKYTSTYVFPNDFPAVALSQPECPPNAFGSDEETSSHENNPDLDSETSTKTSTITSTKSNINSLKQKLLKVSGVKGQCFVICFSPNHSLTLPLMAAKEIEGVISTWQKLYLDTQKQSLEHKAPYKYLQIFENKGSAMGCSNPHPHGQAWCLDVVPTEVSTELSNMTKYKQQNGTHLLGDYVQLELADRKRVVVDNASFVAVVPFWAMWPFETLVLAKTHVASVAEFTPQQTADLASLIKTLTIKYDNLFKTSFPYSMGIHQAPLDATPEEKATSWFHMHFYPPLLRSSTVKKFCVGFELLGESQRDLTSEQAAARLQELSGERHYTEL